MDKVHSDKILAKPELRAFLKDAQKRLRQLLPVTSFAQREGALLAVANELVRGALCDELREVSSSFADELLIDGVAFRTHQQATVTYHGLAGSMDVARATFRQVGVRNGPTVVPLELECGLVEHATPALAYSIAHGYAQHDMRLHHEILEAGHRHTPSRTTMERMAQRIAGRAVATEARIEKVLRRTESPPAECFGIVIGLDRTSTAMVEDRPANAPPKPGPKRTKPLKRSPPAPFDVNWRMAYVGTVCFVDEHGEALASYRYASPACDDPRSLVEHMTADVRSAIRKNPALSVGIVQDGAPEMWNRTREGLQTLKDAGLLPSWEEGIDRYHLMERFAEALAIVEPRTSERSRLLDLWKNDLDSRDSAIESVQRYLTHSYDRVTDNEQRAKLWDHLGFIRRNKDRMRYVTLRLAHLPVGSGVTESAAKTVVALRAKRSGQRWREKSLRGVLTLRAIHQSDRLSAFWSHLSKDYAARVEAA